MNNKDIRPFDRDTEDEQEPPPGNRIAQSDDDSHRDPDLVLVCADCQCNFTVTSGERSFYESKGLSIPKRCPRCRKARKLREGGK